jgi:hypothetical protein
VVNSCSICTHTHSSEIDEAILKGVANRRIASLHGVTETAVRRHKKHLPADIAKARGAAEIAKADVLLDHIRTGEGRAERLYAAAEIILQRAIDENTPRTALQAIRAAVDVMGEARQYMQFRGEVTGELDSNRNGPGGVDNRRVCIFNFPVASPELLAEVANAPTIDLPIPARRLLQRPSDGAQR